tara:strand:- start:24062 stop:24394 length:333 start_codon:yes stop_codon:yes gene_type:complete
MSTIVKEEKMAEKKSEEKTTNPALYNCEIILKKTTLEKVKDPSFPSDAKLIWYEVNEETHIDLCRGGNVKIFDMYYDQYGPGAVKKIDFGYGKTNPRNWGYKAPEVKKRK